MLASARLLATLALVATASAQSFPNFESPQIAPVAIAADGSRLLVTNTPDNRVALFSLANPTFPALLREIPVGLEPVSARFRTADEAWVVNHLSDSISVVDLVRGVVVDTLRVGDEPSDVVFANGRAFVTVATRRRVEVFDATTRAKLGDIPVFADEPRWSVASDDGTKLYVAAHKSGNDTTLVSEAAAPAQTAPTNPDLPAPPSVGLIVDSEDPTWAATHGVVLPDYDVFEIDTSSLTMLRRFSDVGTLLFGLDVDPLSGDVWVANTEARNLIRYEPTLRGHIVDHRVTRITQAGAVQAFDLNAGIDYGTLPNPSALATAIGQPTDIEFAPDGSESFVAGFGTDRIGVLDGNGAVLARIDIGDATSARDKRGPRALAHHPTAPVLYVVNRLSNSLSIVDVTNRVELLEMPLVFDPTPQALKEGRGFLYDCKLSGNGTASCAVCHVDGTTDNLAWDLGDPGGEIFVATVAPPQIPFTFSADLHPMKGPMTTQSLVGLDDSEPFHWRGDRNTFQDFNPAFDALMGGSQLASSDMDAFANFIHTVRYAPNPNQNRDRTFATTPAGESAEDGRVIFTTTQFEGGPICVSCHSLDTGSNSVIIPGSLLLEPQAFKVPQLRNIYKRDGKKDSGGLRTAGFGLLHDGTHDDVFDFLSLPIFGALASDTTSKTALMRFVESFDTGLAPAVGFDVTFRRDNHQDADLLIDRALLIGQAHAGNCDLVVRGEIEGRPTGLLYDTATGSFLSDRVGAAPRTLTDLDQLLSQDQATLTFLGVVPGHGQRIARDRDGDGTLDGDEFGTHYGDATAGCNIRHRENSPAFAGNLNYGIVAEGATPGAAGVLLVGVASAWIPILGIEVLVDPTEMFPVPAIADATGTAVFPIPINDDPASVGLPVRMQALFVDSCGPQGLAATDGIGIEID